MLNHENNRGKINHIGRKQQIITFENLVYNKITPTDMDGLIEYKNKAYILLEIKYKETKLPIGQELALTRLIFDLNKVKNSILIIAEHYIDNYNNWIDARKCIVREVYYKNYKKGEVVKNKKIYKNKFTVGEIIDRFIENLEGVN